MKVTRILVVCIGNICRSPMAEILQQQAMGPAVSVSSAGLGALVGNGADPHALALMAERGLDLSAHRARQIDQGLVSGHELILVMTQRQKESLEREFPSARGRVFRLGHWQNQDIADPYQKDRAAFELALHHIDQGITDWCARLTPATARP